MVLCPTLHHHEREVTLLDRLMHGTTDGAVLMLPEESNDELKALQPQGLSLRHRRPARDARRGHPGRLRRQRLGRARGDRAPALARPPAHRRDHGSARYLASSERLNGYEGALAAAGVLPDPGDHARVHVRHRGRREGRRPRLLDAADPPTAIFAFNDNIAIGALRVARERGIRVPEDLSVVGFDDSEIAAIVTPALTTVRQPLAEMGRMAVSLLMRILDNQRLEALHIELKTRLIVRASTARVPEA